VKEQVELHNLRTDHVIIRSELKYLIGGKVVMLKCRVLGSETGPFPVGRVLGSETGPFPVGRVFRVVRPIATVQFQVEPEPELTRRFGPIAHTLYVESHLGKPKFSLVSDTNCIHILNSGDLDC
jgi:hypothetical protein